ncbi:hypothetical protein [Desulfosarcina cetonica]|uniref:hypothetical protein n=1 Tax=Desulfosarcina cetonica TaxID=90730 RepID=UPI00155DDBD1|nr:hypothetical protein [Desulfosarcina cetonica]
MKHRARRPASPGREVLYGVHPVTEALIANRRRIDALLIDRKVPSERQGGSSALPRPVALPWSILRPRICVRPAAATNTRGWPCGFRPCPWTIWNPLT